MRRAVLIAGIISLTFIATGAALAATETASGGTVAATFAYQGKFPQFHGLRLTISRTGVVVYDQPVTSKFCGSLCDPLSAVSQQPSVHVIDVEHTGDPDVLLDLYTGGAHCCIAEQIFSFAAASNTYVKTERDFGDAEAQVADLRHDGRFEFLSADDSFAYRFTDYAASGLPIQILTFSEGRFSDVTRSYPNLIARDAARWMKAFKRMARQHYPDSVGVVAAWAADQDLLGHRKLVSRVLARQAKLGHLNAPSAPGGLRFVADLQKFLRQRGYVR